MRKSDCFSLFQVLCEFYSFRLFAGSPPPAPASAWSFIVAVDDNSSDIHESKEWLLCFPKKSENAAIR